MDFIETYTKYTENQESPSTFHSWVAISILSAAIKRKAWLPRGFYTLYPNTYVVLVGPAGRQKKSTAINIGTSLLTEATKDVYMLKERMTPEGILQALNRLSVNTNSGHVAMESTLFAVAPELMVMFGADKIQASRMISYLTTWYDSPDLFPYTTVAHGALEFHNLYVTLLAATAEEFLYIIPPDAQGGFLSRVIFVHSREHKRIPRPTQGNQRAELIRIIREVYKMSGPFITTPKTDAMFDEWYMSIPDVEDSRLRGFMERMPDHALKIACLLAAGRGTMTISANILDLAIAMMKAVLPGVGQALSFVGTTTEVQLTAAMLEQITRLGTVAKIQLYNLNSFRAGVEEIDRSLKDLAERKVVHVKFDGTNEVYSPI